MKAQVMFEITLRLQTHIWLMCAICMRIEKNSCGRVCAVCIYNKMKIVIIAWLDERTKYEC